jgi:hypothetical protein
MFRSLFDSRPASRKLGRHARRPAARRLTVEALDDRIVPASLSVSDVTITEGNVGTQNAQVTVTLSGSVNSPVTVNYTTANGTALGGNDYLATSGTLTFANGQTSKAILVPVIGDLVNEPTETFSVNLQNAKHASIADGQAIVTVVDNDQPTIRINDVSAPEGNTGTTPFAFTVTLSAASTTPVTVNWATANGTAVAGSDYQAASGTLTFAPGQTSQTVTVLVNGDRLGELSEKFFVNLSSPTNARIADGQAVASIMDDEPRISIGDIFGAEGNSGTTPFTFSVTLSNAYDAPVAVDYATSNGTAAADSDYAAASGSLTFAAGEISKTLTVLVNGERLGEMNETFFVNLSNPSSARVYVGQGAGMIVDDDPRISIGDVSALEGNDGTTELTFTLTLSTASDVPVTVAYATADGTAEAGSDYQAASGTLTFAPGESSQTVTVLVNGDGLAEPDETFIVSLTLSDPTNAGIADGQGVGTVTDDEPRLRIDTLWGTEGNDGTTEFLFMVTLSPASDAPVTVDYVTADYGAWAGSDYQAAAGTLTFAAGETTQFITVLVNGDLDAESDESFLVILSNPAGASLGGSAAEGVIVNDDAPVGLMVYINSQSGYEGAPFFFDVWLSYPANETVTVHFYTVDGAAVDGWDYYGVSGTLTFEPGETRQTIYVQTIRDNFYDGVEDFLVFLNITSNNADLGSDPGSGVIWNLV